MAYSNDVRRPPHKLALAF